MNECKEENYDTNNICNKDNYNNNNNKKMKSKRREIHQY